MQAGGWAAAQPVGSGSSVAAPEDRRQPAAVLGDRIVPIALTGPDTSR
jgi:hypothetical protein